MIVSKSYEGNKIMTDLKPNETTGQPPASQENPHKPSDKHILNPPGKYIRNFMWVISSSMRHQILSTLIIYVPLNPFTFHWNFEYNFN